MAVYILYYNPIYRDIAINYQLRQVKPNCMINSTEAENINRPATINQPHAHYLILIVPEITDNKVPRFTNLHIPII